MISQVSTQCSQCGGTAEVVPGKQYLQCPYCLSLVFTADNPLSTDGILPLGDQIEDAYCPACSRQLSKGQIDDKPVLYCELCYGLLIRREHFGSVVRERRARREGMEVQRTTPLDPIEYERAVDCPSCNKRMEVHPYYGPGNVIIDSCHTCSYVWLDHGELKTIERSEGGKTELPSPIYVDDDGDLTTIPPPVRLPTTNRTSPLGIIDALFRAIFDA